jgi:hypothetical protein
LEHREINDIIETKAAKKKPYNTNNPKNKTHQKNNKLKNVIKKKNTKLKKKKIKNIQRN